MQVWLQGNWEKHPTKAHTLNGCTLGPAARGRELLCIARGHLDDKAATLLIHLSQALSRWAEESHHRQSLWSKYACWDLNLKWPNSSFLLTRSKKWLSRYYKSLLDKASGCSKSETALAVWAPTHLGADLQDQRACRGYNYWGQESLGQKLRSKGR